MRDLAWIRQDNERAIAAHIASMNCPRCNGKLKDIQLNVFSDNSGANVEASCTRCTRNFVVPISEGSFIDTLLM
jgi:hypothetical protein